MPSAAKPKKNKVDQDRKSYAGICQMLFQNELTPGQKISYKALADRLGVSTTPVIHALKWLEFKGIVRHEPNKGYYTNRISLAEVREIYDARLLLEVSMLSQAVNRVDSPGLDRLEKSFDGHAQAVADMDYYRRLLTDMDFHLTLASLSGNQIQYKLLKEVFDRLLLKYSQSLTAYSMIETSQSEHRAIIEALKKRQVEGVGEAMSKHLKVTRDRVIQGMTQAAGRSREDQAAAVYPVDF